MTWTLPSFLLVPEIEGHPLFILLIGLEVWAFIVWLHLLPVIAVLGAIFGDRGKS